MTQPIQKSRKVDILLMIIGILLIGVICLMPSIGPKLCASYEVMCGYPSDSRIDYALKSLPVIFVMAVFFTRKGRRHEPA